MAKDTFIAKMKRANFV